ncbi:unnamed protein product [Ambrosiozyma monospora]|uniref:ribonuclease T2 n=1 Tax=Ambrosiozyma monospora TaxID=43982 RepID=A0A9W7DHP9_AMBMO|nr:unnamed protein product [Ambrosiozyma monospora]
MKQVISAIPLIALTLMRSTSAIHLPESWTNQLPDSFSLKANDNELKPFEYHQCPVDMPLSCTNNTEIGDSCCFEYPGGVLLQTQFWDYYPPVGPDDMFTLHGLWPDLCNGQFEQFCDDSMNIESAETILKDFGEEDLLKKMKLFWKNYNGNDESLWIHEFNKHGTCMNTIKSHCYDQSTYKKNQNVVDFYKKTVELFEDLPTYKWLSENGIVASQTQTYTRKQIEDTLSARFGQPVFVKCNNYVELKMSRNRN